MTQPTASLPSGPSLPAQPTYPNVPPTYPISWDPRLDLRKTVIVPTTLTPNQSCWKVTYGKWYDQGEAQGRTSAYITILDENGKIIEGVPVRFFWGGGQEIKDTELKSDPWLTPPYGPPYSLDFNLYHPAPAYNLVVDDFTPSDTIKGLGLGDLNQPDYNIHTAYSFVFQKVHINISPVTSGKILWPVQGTITQRFGETPQSNGIEIALPVSSPVVAPADGKIMWVENDPPGYGLYVRLYLPQFRVHIFLAHLDTVFVQPGQQVRQGELIARSGSLCHVETRLGEENSYALGTYPNSNGRVDPQAAFYLCGGTQIP